MKVLARPIDLSLAMKDWREQYYRDRDREELERQRRPIAQADGCGE